MRTGLRENKARLFLLAFLALSACAAYLPKPLDQKVIDRTLAAPDLTLLRVQAKELKHPLLQPAELDLENGLSPQAAAILAVLANPDILAARAKRGVAFAQLLQAGILPNPQLSYNLDLPTGGDTTGTVNAYGLSLTWDFVPLLVRRAQMDAAKAEARSVDLDIAWQEWQAAMGAKLHLYNLAYLERQLFLGRKEEDGLRSNLETIQRAYDFGDVTAVDLVAAQTALQKVRASVLTIAQQYEQERLLLNQSVGFPPLQDIPLRRDIDPPLIGEEIPPLDKIMDGIEHRRLDLFALRLGYQSEEAKVRGAILAQFPKLGVGFSRARDTSNIVTTGFSVSIDLPLFNRNQGQIAIEQATRAQLFEEYLARLFDARSTIAAAMANIRSIEEQVHTAENAIPIATRLVETYRAAFLEGNADVLTYYNAVNDLFSRHIDLLSLQKDLSSQMVALEIASGQFIVTAEGKKVSK